MWVGLLLVVFVVITDILPIGHGLSPRGIFQEKRLMATAKKMEDQNLWYAAAEIYEGMAQDSSASSKARGESAEHLFNLYTKDIPDLDKAHRALEKAVFFAKKPEKKQQLKKQLEDSFSPPSAGIPSRWKNCFTVGINCTGRSR
ncbi:hypothetical protein HY256_02205 [Candidatus Sumerlaeota bacterium]|nr:hypothetical protein [Candidatus Sumerlaeota bacterium]